MPGDINPYAIVLETDGSDEQLITTQNGNRRARGRIVGGIRDKATMAEMKARMMVLWKQGEMYETIGEMVTSEFGLPKDQRIRANAVHYHVKNQIKHWKEVGLLAVDEKMALVLARYDQLEEICTNAYYASIEGRVTTNYKKQITRARSKEREKMLKDQIEAQRNEEISSGKKITIHDIGNLEEALITTQENIEEYERIELNEAGDPRWVALLLDINDKRAKLWNLHNKSAEQDGDKERARLSDTVRDERIKAIMISALMRKTGDLGNLAPAAPLGGHKTPVATEGEDELDDD